MSPVNEKTIAHEAKMNPVTFDLPASLFEVNVIKLTNRKLNSHHAKLMKYAVDLE